MKKYIIYIIAGVLGFFLILGIIVYTTSGTFLKKTAEKSIDDSMVLESIPAAIVLFPLKACSTSFLCLSALQYPFLYAIVNSFESYHGDIYECTTPTGIKLFLPKSLAQERGICKLIWHNKARVSEEEKQNSKNSSNEIIYKKFEYSFSDNRVLFEYPQDAALKMRSNGVSFSLESQNEKEIKSMFIDFTLLPSTPASYTKNEISKLLERGWNISDVYELNNGSQVQEYASDLLVFPQEGMRNCGIGYLYVMPLMVGGKEQTGILSFSAHHNPKQVSTSSKGDIELSWCTLYERGTYEQYKNTLSHILSTFQ